MPELPEVETTLQGIAPHLLHQTIANIIVRDHRLRWPVPADIHKRLVGQKILAISRRAKYLLLTLKKGTVIIHLGMSGHLSILKKPRGIKKHDHIDVILQNKTILRLNDPRRFGAFLWCEGDAKEHGLLKNLGVEPLTSAFSGRYLWTRAQGRKVSVKSFLMNHQIVSGVGNIYATEALFLAGIHPNSTTGKITLTQFTKLVKAVKQILKQSIKRGGTTLRDFMDSDGKPGYFSHQLQAYGRAGEACKKCRNKLQPLKIGQRSTVFCKTCQPKV